MEVESKAEYYTLPMPNAQLAGSCTAVGSRQETFKSPLSRAEFLIFEPGLIGSAKSGSQGLGYTAGLVVWSV
jgi:hypothetical protein